MNLFLPGRVRLILAKVTKYPIEKRNHIRLILVHIMLFYHCVVLAPLLTFVCFWGLREGQNGVFFGKDSIRFHGLFAGISVNLHPYKPGCLVNKPK